MNQEYIIRRDYFQDEFRIDGVGDEITYSSPTLRPSGWPKYIDENALVVNARSMLEVPRLSKTNLQGHEGSPKSNSSPPAGKSLSNSNTGRINVLVRLICLPTEPCPPGFVRRAYSEMSVVDLKSVAGLIPWHLLPMFTYCEKTLEVELERGQVLPVGVGQ